MSTEYPKQRIDVPNSTLAGQYSFVSQFVSLGLPDRVVDRLYGNKSYDDIEDTKLYTSLVHEYTHFTQNLTTTYGVWKTLRMRVAGSAFWQGILRAAALGRQLRSPIDALMKIRGTTLTDIDEFEYPFIIGRSCITSINMLEAGYRIEPGITFSDIAAPADTTNPSIDCGGVAAPLTALTLMEFQAYARQVRSLFNMPGIPKAHAEALASKIVEYPHFRIPQNVVAAAFERGSIDQYVLGQLAFELATVALSAEWPGEPLHALSPLPAKLSDVDGDKVPWEHFHPGWRLVRLMETIKSRRMGFPSAACAPEFIAELLDALGWPQPTDAVRALYAKLEHEDTKEVMSDFLGVRDQVLSVVTSCAGYTFPSQRYADVVHSYFGTHTLIHGPRPRYDRVNDFALLADVAIQKYYARRLFCPMCLAYDHRDECRLKEIV